MYERSRLNHIISKSLPEVAHNCHEQTSAVQILPKSRQQICSTIKRSYGDIFRTKCQHTMQIQVNDIHPNPLEIFRNSWESPTTPHMTPLPIHTPPEQVGRGMGKILIYFQYLQWIRVEVMHTESCLSVRTHCKMVRHFGTCIIL